MMLQERYALPEGLSIPKLGLGTWFIDDAKAAEAVLRIIYAHEKVIGIDITAHRHRPGLWQRAGRGRGCPHLRAPPGGVLRGQQGGRRAQDL